MTPLSGGRAIKRKYKDICLSHLCSLCCVTKCGSEPKLQEDGSLLSFSKPSAVLRALNLPPWVLVCYWDTAEFMNSLIVFLGKSFHSHVTQKEARREQVSISWDPWNNFIQMDTNLFPQGRGCSAQCLGIGALSFPSCSYCNLVCDVGTSLPFSQGQTG